MEETLVALDHRAKPHTCLSRGERRLRQLWRANTRLAPTSHVDHPTRLFLRTYLLPNLFGENQVRETTSANDPNSDPERLKRVADRISAVVAPAKAAFIERLSSK